MPLDPIDCPPVTRAARWADAARAAPLALVCLLSLAVVWGLAPQKTGLVLWGLCKLCLGGYLGYWTDRWAFGPQARPHRVAGLAQAAAWLRRALIIAASVIATALLP